MSEPRVPRRRVFGRVLDALLGPLVRWRYETFIGIGHLRAARRGLTFIAILCIAGVALGSCTLSSVIAIMGGFGADLKRKILGNHAHVTLDRRDGEIVEYEPLLARVRAHPSVLAATPYLQGEVMISSETNLSGVLLRGVDPSTIGSVVELRRNLLSGNLDWLEHPERLLDIPDESEPPPRLLPEKAPPAEGEARKSRVTVTELRRTRVEGEAVGEAAPEPTEGGTEAAPARPARRGPAREVLPGIVIGRELSRNLRLYVGDEVTVIAPLGDIGPSGPIPKLRPFRIAGVFFSGMYEYDSKYAYVTIPVAQRFLGVAAGVTGIEVKVRNAERADRVARSLSVGAPAGVRVRDWMILNRTLFSALKLEKIVMFVFLSLAIIEGAFSIVAMLLLLVTEKGKEIAILKSLGATDAGIMRIFMFEGLLIGIIGSLTGVTAGFLFCTALKVWGHLLTVILRPIVPSFSDVYYVDRLPVHVFASDLVVVALAAILISFLATLYPAWAASRVQPVEGMRYEA